MRYFILIFCALALSVVIILGFDKFTGDNDIQILETGRGYDSFVTELKTEIKAQGLTIAEGACGKCAIKTLKDIDENDLVITVYRADLMMRMLQSGAVAGAEPPLRFYISKLEDGNARLTYHLPSKALEIYKAPALKPIGLELDATFAKIIKAVR